MSESGQCALNFKKGIDKGEGRRRRVEGEKGGRGRGRGAREGEGGDGAEGRIIGGRRRAEGK